MCPPIRVLEELSRRLSRLAMPQFPFTASELYDASLLHEMAMAIDDDEGSDDDVVEALMYAAAEPFYRQRLQDIGPEHLSIARLWRTFTGGEGDQSASVEAAYGFRLEDLQTVVDALEPPAGFRTHSGSVFSGEEGVLLLLRRFRSTEPLYALTHETGRSATAISEAVQYMVEHVHNTFAL